MRANIPIRRERSLVPGLPGQAADIQVFAANPGSRELRKNVQLRQPGTAELIDHEIGDEYGGQLFQNRKSHCRQQVAAPTPPDGIVVVSAVAEPMPVFGKSILNRHWIQKLKYEISSIATDPRASGEYPLPWTDR